MKKFLLVFLVFGFLPCLNVHGQMTVIDAGLNAWFDTIGISQYILFGEMLLESYEHGKAFAQQIEHFTEQAQRQVQNLASAKDIKNWDDFMDFYNRQLYLERMTAETFDNMKVTIGKKQYHLTDIEGMAYGMKDTYIDYWDKEFTEEQRREMWLELGLTPANYAYVQPFRARAREIVKEGLTAGTIQNEWYMRNMQKNNERQKKLAEDELKPTKDKMGSKEITMMILESLLETNKVMNDIAMNQAAEREARAVDAAIDKTPNTSPGLSNWPKDDSAFKK